MKKENEKEKWKKRREIGKKKRGKNQKGEEFRPNLILRVWGDIFFSFRSFESLVYIIFFLKDPC